MAERVTLNRDFSLIEGDWDAGEARARIFAKFTNAEGEFDAAGAADYFLISDPDTGAKGDLHLPVGDIREGKSVIVSGALRAVRSRLAQKETLPDVAADVKERANDLAGSLLEELRARKDALCSVHDWSTGVMLPIPSEFAAMFPPREGHTPHITLVHITWTTPEETTQILQIVSEEVDAFVGEEISLGEIAYFERYEDRVAYVQALVSAKVRTARERIAAKVAALDIEVSRLGEEWIPHATLDVLPIGQDFVGTVPVGTWTIDRVEVWHGGERRAVPEASEEPGNRVDAGRHQAPAVITEPKTMVEVVRADAVEIIEPVRHPDGWVEYSVTYSRAGNIQEYGGVREYRPPEEVFAPAAMASARGAPWELRHSSDLLSPRTVLGVARGCILTFDRHSDGIHTVGRAKAWDQGLIDAIAGPAPEVSLAYRTLVDRRPGTTDNGQPFDQRATNLVINSLASEPKGKGGATVRVHADGVDSADIVTRADAMLKLAQEPPTRLVYFDQSRWVGYDAQDAAEKDDETMPKPLTILVMKMLESRGLTGADAAKALGIEVADFEALIADPKAIDEEMLGKLAGLFAAQDAGEESAEVDPDKAKLLEEMAAALADPKADRGAVRALFDRMMGEPDPEQPEQDADDDMVSIPKAELEALREQASRADSAEQKIEDMIPRADAAAMVLEEGLNLSKIIWLAKATHGQEFTPEPRKDKDGKELPLNRSDWEKPALVGAFGDEKGLRELERIDAAPEGARSFTMANRIEDAIELVEKSMAGHTSGEVKATVARLRAAKNQDSTNEDGLAAARKAQRERAAGITPPNGD